jgi:hypothetical protein
MPLLITRTPGRLLQIIGAHIGTANEWGAVQSQIIAAFLPPRLKEQFLVKYVLERFQGPTEDLTAYVMSIVVAARILEFAGTESQLVQRIVQNLHPTVKSHCIFQERPQTISQLFSFATVVTEAVAIETQRRQRDISSPPGDAPRALGNASGQTRPPLSQVERKLECWACGKIGHLQRACPTRTRPKSKGKRSENTDGARR